MTIRYESLTRLFKWEIVLVLSYIWFETASWTTVKIKGHVSFVRRFSLAVRKKKCRANPLWFARTHTRRSFPTGCFNKRSLQEPCSCTKPLPFRQRRGKNRGRLMWATTCPDVSLAARCSRQFTGSHSYSRGFVRLARLRKEPLDGGHARTFPLAATSNNVGPCSRQRRWWAETEGWHLRAPGSSLPTVG